MKKYKILVVDDEFKTEEKRRKRSIEEYLNNDWIRGNTNIPHAEKLLSELPTEFEVFTCATMDEFKQILEKEKIDAFFIDYVLYDENRLLETGDFDTNGFNNVLYKIKEKCGEVPIFVYSSQWSEDSIYKLLEDFKEVFAYNKFPNNLLTFKTFENTIRDFHLNKEKPAWNKVNDLEKDRKLIWEAIATANEHVRFQPSASSGDIVILHISDLQFGDQKTTINWIGIWQDMAREINKYLKNHNLKYVDLVVITGDVAMSGRKSEYDDAKKGLLSLMDKLWENDPNANERIIMVPGNHDFDINTSVLEYFKAKNRKGERAIDFDSVIDQIKECIEGKSEKSNNEYRRLGLQAFREFAFDITQDKKYICSENLDFVVDKFADWGLRFLCLNSVYDINAKKTNKALFNLSGIEKMVEGIERNRKLLTILLSHHTPLVLEELEEKEKENLNTTFTALRRSCEAQIVMGGHRHKNQSHENSNSEQKVLHVIEAASLRVEETEDDYVRGFALVTIKRELSEAAIQYFEFDKKDGVIKKKDAYELDLKG